MTFWPLRLKEDGAIIGPIGFLTLTDDLRFKTACSGVEMGWTLAREHWGQGYATEMGRALLIYAARTLQLADLVTFTAWENLPSLAVMQRLGFGPWAAFDGRFEHPALPVGHPLRRHRLLHRTLDEFRPKEQQLPVF